MNEIGFPKYPLHKIQNLLWVSASLADRGGGRGGREGSNAPPYLPKIPLTSGKKN
jgi:hypothetical protein